MFIHKNPVCSLSEYIGLFLIKIFLMILQNIEFKLSLDSDYSECNRVKFTICFIKDTLEFMLKNE